MAGGGVIVVEALCVEIIVSIKAGHEAHELLIEHGGFHLLLLVGPDTAEFLACLGTETVLGRIHHGVVDGSAANFGELKLLREIHDHLICGRVHVGAGKSLGDFLVGDTDTEVFIFFVEQFLGEETLDDSLCEDVVTVVAALVAELFAGLGETVLIVLIFHCHTSGLCHGGGRAEIGAS